MRTVLYARVSTVEQTIAHQEAHARAEGFSIDEVIADEGVSGVRVPLRERPEGRRLFDVLRAGDVLVVRWVDRLGRNYADVTEVIRQFMARGVIIKTVINRMTFDGATQDPMQKAVRDALIAFMAATAEAQAEATREAQRAGIAHAIANEPQSYRGRKPSSIGPSLTSSGTCSSKTRARARLRRRQGFQDRWSTGSRTTRPRRKPFWPGGVCRLMAWTLRLRDGAHGGTDTMNVLFIGARRRASASSFGAVETL